MTDEVPTVSEVDLGVFPRDSHWGNRIVFDDFEERRVHGWISPRVSDGDMFGYQMKSGKVAVFKLKNVDNQTDPSDMFFAYVEDVGYLYD